MKMWLNHKHCHKADLKQAIMSHFGNAEVVLSCYANTVYLGTSVYAGTIKVASGNAEMMFCALMKEVEVKRDFYKISVVAGETYVVSGKYLNLKYNSPKW